MKFTLNTTVKDIRENTELKSLEEYPVQITTDSYYLRMGKCKDWFYVEWDKDNYFTEMFNQNRLGSTDTVENVMNKIKEYKEQNSSGKHAFYFSEFFFG